MSSFDHEKLDVYKAAIQLIEEKQYIEARQLLLRIVSMLIKMAQNSHQSGTGTHTGTGTIE